MGSKYMSQIVATASVSSRLLLDYLPLVDDVAEVCVLSGRLQDIRYREYSKILKVVNDFRSSLIT